MLFLDTGYTITVLESCAFFFFLFQVRIPWGYANAMQIGDSLRFTGKEGI